MSMPVDELIYRFEQLLQRSLDDKEMEFIGWLNLRLQKQAANPYLSKRSKR
ncbi:hypothetical protein N781_01145 [Pontibacillus halophilus JSM 076056 = DSM 19796]|uniref:Uncharacterized protein n=1 Tax=Pontibacillus halophilus JSM 076056 = DSM 19796 TaxID=1385510 RepID=A0A0A5GQ44_9BACI|nr:hypothetical protein [Pontibacillus halophilus]KGX94069.1 hypothetical protein N781_01145 [Pontibacillus halophilus JSM 076056 = DSM 19796]